MGTAPDGKKSMTIYVAHEVWHELKREAARRGTSMGELVEEALSMRIHIIRTGFVRGGADVGKLEKATGE